MRSPRVRAIISTVRSTAESIPSPSRSIFRKPASEQESLSHWTIWRPSIAAGTIGQQSISGRVAMIIPPECWDRWRGRPWASAASRASHAQRPPRRAGRRPRPRAAQVAPRIRLGRRRVVVVGDGERPLPRLANSSPELDPERALDVPGHLARVPALASPRHPLDLPRRQAQRLAELADRAPRAVGGKGRHQRRAVVAVALVHARDQLLADVAREVEVDVGQRGQLLVEEAPDQQLVGDRVDVREPGQVADDRGDARAAAAARRQQRAGAVGTAHLDRHLARQLEHVVVQQEEARQPQRLDDPHLLLQPRLRAPADVRRRVARSARASARRTARPACASRRSSSAPG